MKLFLQFFFALFLVTAIYPQNYKQIKVHINNQQDIARLAHAGIDLEGISSPKENSITIFVESAELKKITNLGLGYTVLIDDWKKYFNTMPKVSETQLYQQISESKAKYGVTGFVPNGSMSGHFTFEEVKAQLDLMKSQYPNLISAKTAIGTSVEGRPIYMVKISNSPNSDNGKPEVLYTALHHAREPGGMMATLYYMYYLLENYNTNSSVKYLVDNRQIYFVPVVNPDGYVYNQTTDPSGGGMWRKNRRLNSDNSYGVDLNRNYGPFAYWNSLYAPDGSSTNTFDETYRGTAPFSEPEIESIRSFVTQHKFKTNLNYHTFGGYLIFPWGAMASETPDSITFREFAVKITGWNNYSYGTDMQTVGYSTRGGSDDFMYSGDTTGSRGKILGMTPEVGFGQDGFWASQARILPIAEENLNPNLFISWVAGEYVSLQNANFQQQYFNPGETVQLKPEIKNLGLSTGYNLSCTLTSLSSYASIIDGQFMLDSLKERTSRILSPFSFSLSSDAPANGKIKFLFEVKSGAVSLSRDTISLTVGVPAYTFIDTTNNPLTLWTITANPSAPKWEATTSSFYSSPNSYTDSRNGNYSDNATVTMTSTNPINLSGVNNPKLSFWSKWDMESSWDCGIVQVSSDNGVSWNYLTGLYTRPGSGRGRQLPSGIPVYDAVSSGWIKEEMDLAAYAGKQIKLKFELRSDEAVNKDGWYVDDIGIYTYRATPVELSSFTVNTVKDKINLNWSTITELNNRGFEIQRSLSDGPDKYWQTIAFIKGSGTTQQPVKYSFLDSKPLRGKSFYRLKQIDFNGSYKIYGPVEAQLFGDIDFTLEQNYPNPFNPGTLIKYTIPADDIVTIKLYNVLGSEIAVLINEFKEAGKYELKLNIDNLKGNIGSGVYFYTIKSGRYSQTRKMVVLK